MHLAHHKVRNTCMQHTHLHIGRFMRVHGRVDIVHLHEGLEAGAFVKHNNLVHLAKARENLLQRENSHLFRLSKKQTAQPHNRPTVENTVCA